MRNPGQELLIEIPETPLVIPSESCNFSVTTSTTFLNASISSSTVPPSPALEKLTELPT